jgi:hypothetical protein
MYPVHDSMPAVAAARGGKVQVLRQRQLQAATAAAVLAHQHLELMPSHPLMVQQILEAAAVLADGQIVPVSMVLLEARV